MAWNFVFFFNSILLGIGLAMDAFSVSMANGLNEPKMHTYTSTLALTNATLPYALQLADKGWRKACADNEELRKGLSVVEGEVVYKEVAEAWGLPYEPLSL